MGKRRITPLKIAGELPDGLCGYIAGTIDADGSVGAHPKKYMSVYNNDVDMLLSLQEHIGGHLSLAGDTRDGRNKPVYQLTLRIGEMTALLPQILKYMIVKRKPAEDLLELLLGEMFAEEYKASDMTSEELFKAIELWYQCKVDLTCMV